VLGYENERGAKVTFSYSTAQGTRDLARNGTYLVFRQLKQHVDVFKSFSLRNSRSATRWPGGKGTEGTDRRDGMGGRAARWPESQRQAAYPARTNAGE
jgi:deferrochelatase/peroxidase EfeB